MGWVTLPNILKYIVGFEVFTAVSIKMVVFWVVAPCSLVEIYQNFYQTTWCYNPEDSHLHFEIHDSV
jgi:hypothetical protein